MILDTQELIILERNSRRHTVKTLLIEFCPCYNSVLGDFKGISIQDL